MATAAFANNYDVYFTKIGEYLCASQNLVRGKTDANGFRCPSMLTNHIRTRLIDPPKSSRSPWGFDVKRPFFILDGIYLSTDGVRTLNEFESEVIQFGISDVLLELGYTPILVQFDATVRQSLDVNASYFAQLLKFFNKNKFFEFKDKSEDGMIILGISQGGILGRYGAYLYDTSRNSSDAPVRLYASMDSPHQGAVMPQSLLYTINFWATAGGSAAAEAFRDMIHAPGASGLLLHNVNPSCGQSRCAHKYVINTDESRFLFGEYRKAAEYKGFPSVLISQGQFKGKSPSHSRKYFELNRKATKFGMVMGRAESYLSNSNSDKDEFVYNRMYQKIKDDVREQLSNSTPFDFVQGSTYPFAQTLYESLKEGFYEEMPNNMKIELFSALGMTADISISTSWDKDSLYQKSSTFIPTTSAMDLKCNGALSIKDNCAFTQSASGFPFASPGTRSSANAVYAVDPTHPRYSESISGRHIEMPVDEKGHIDTTVLRGMQVDMWRVLCEVSHYDYNASAKAFRNEYLNGVFAPNVNCMDIGSMPDVIKNSGLKNTRNLAYARYDYNKKATEKTSSVTFDVPAGWHKVATYDNGTQIPANSDFEIDITVNNSKGSWFKAELLLFKSKSESGQFQMKEIDVPVDGKKHTIQWSMPSTDDMLRFYRWFRLVMNSDGANVTLSKPRLVKKAFAKEQYNKVESNLYPSSRYDFVTWTQSAIFSNYSDALGRGLSIKFANYGAGGFIDFGEFANAGSYKNLKVTFWPGTCENTGIYFGSYSRGIALLRNGTAKGNFLSKTIPIADIVSPNFIQGNAMLTSRLSIQGQKPDERCIIHDIMLE